jgi:hypothetical protein
LGAAALAVLGGGALGRHQRAADPHDRPPDLPDEGACVYLLAGGRLPGLPRWASNGGASRCHGWGPYAREDIPASEQQILSDIAWAIEIRDYQLPIDDPRHHFTGLAAGLSKVLYRCPNCHTVEGLGAVRPLSTNQIECRSCFSTWRVDLASRVTPVDEHGQDVGESHTVAMVPAHPDRP